MEEDVCRNNILKSSWPISMNNTEKMEEISEEDTYGFGEYWCSGKHR